MTRTWNPRYALLLLAAVAVSIPAHAGSPADVTTSAWGMVGKVKTKVSFGPFGETKKEEASVVAYFGPVATPEPFPDLEAGEFLFLIDTADLVVPLMGTYTLDEKGRPSPVLPAQDLAFLAGEFEDVLLGMLAQSGLPIQGASLSTVAASIEFKVKPKAKSRGDKIKLKVECELDMLLTMGEVSTPVALTFKVKGKGVRSF